jgi:hypothetical protein
MSLPRTPQTTSSVGTHAHWHPGTYLTDGVHLLRAVSSPIVEAGRGFVAVEDCRTLDVVLYAQEELAALRLRLVRPACEPELDNADPPASGRMEGLLWE